MVRWLVRIAQYACACIPIEKYISTFSAHTIRNCERNLETPLIFISILCWFFFRFCLLWVPAPSMISAENLFIQFEKWKIVFRYCIRGRSTLDRNRMFFIFIGASSVLFTSIHFIINKWISSMLCRTIANNFLIAHRIADNVWPLEDPDAMTMTMNTVLNAILRTPNAISFPISQIRSTFARVDAFHHLLPLFVPIAMHYRVFRFVNWPHVSTKGCAFEWVMNGSCSWYKRIGIKVKWKMKSKEKWNRIP